ncbi:MAG: HEAT repeat domain-containing protein, partial [Candidatus Binatia bacterium]
PEVRLELAERAALMAGPAAAPVFRDAFLDAIRPAEPPAVRLAALRGLRHLRGDEAVEKALVEAASDPAEEVRAAAIENLALRPERREELRRLVESEGDSTVKAIGECRLLLADSPFTAGSRAVAAAPLTGGGPAVDSPER